MADQTRSARRIVPGSDGHGRPSEAPPPDAMQVLSSGRYVHTDLTLNEFFDPNPDTETPIGADERTVITNTTDVPWRKICQLSFKLSGRFAARGTGWLAGPRTVVTAGHNLLSKRSDALSTEIKIAPGRANAESAPFRVFEPARVSVHELWASDRNVDFDIACLHLDEPIGNDLGWFSFANFDDDTLRAASVNIAGYPLHGPNRETLLGMVPYFHANRIKDVRENRIFYEVDTTAGQSGAPVWLREREDDPPIVVGIHTYGETEEFTEAEIGEANSATRINPKIVALIKSWIAEDARADPSLPPPSVLTDPPTTNGGPDSSDGGSEAAVLEFRQFLSERGAAAADSTAAESGGVTGAVGHAIAALNAAVAEYAALSQRLLRRTRVQQRLDLYASIGTLILSSSLFATAQTDAPTWVTFAVGLLTVLFAIVALVAKRMGGGEGGLMAKYIDLESFAADSRLLAEQIKIKASVDGADLDAEIEQALTATRQLTKERNWALASDFLFRDGGWWMRLLGDK